MRIDRVRIPCPWLWLALPCAILCGGCEDFFNAVLFGPELCAEGIVSDAKGDPVPETTVALIWHCQGTDCTTYDCSECSGLGSEHVLTDSVGYYRVTDRVLDGDCECGQCMWDLKAEAPGYRQVSYDRLGSSRCSRCEIRNFTLVLETSVDREAPGSPAW